MMKDKDLKEIQGLISVGKERGYVTYEEMNNVLPPTWCPRTSSMTS